MIPLVVGVFLLPFVIFAMVVLIPPINAMFALIWEDPRERQRHMVLKRLKELHVDGDVPAETAVLMASQENNITEEQLKAAVGMFSASEIKSVLLGQRSLSRVVIDTMQKTIIAGAAGKGRKVR